MEYNPPTETLPIFDSTVFRTRNTSLTFEEASKYFLEYPTAQGPETLKKTDITGALTCSSTASFGTAGSAANIPICVADYTTILPADSSTKIPTTQWVQTAISANPPVLPPSGVVAGPYTNTNLTVNSQGIITAASNGTGASSNVISTQLFTNNANITFPAGTQFATIMITGAGGGSGFPYTVNNQYTTCGGAGGAGGAIIYSRLPMEASTSMSVVFTNGSTTLNYLPIPQTPYSSTTTPIGTAYAGGAGASAVAGGTNTPPGGAGGGFTQSIAGWGLALAGVGGGGGQSIGSGTFLSERGVNYLTQWNQTIQISSTLNPFNYGIGGYSRINNPLSGDVAIQPAGPACCIVISYSS